MSVVFSSKIPMQPCFGHGHGGHVLCCNSVCLEKFDWCRCQKILDTSNTIV